jgi:uncharacterized protein (TIGR00297 family)
MRYLAAFSKLHPGSLTQKFLFFAALTVIFAVLGRAVRGVTTGGALAGAVVCFALLWAAGFAGFTALFTVFLLTWISTHIGYGRKQRQGTAERRGGRNALQVLANLGTAAGCAVLFAMFWDDRRLLIGMAAALAEAAGDTVSSEIGQAVGGTPRLITNWRDAVPGTDGAITLMGTFFGVAAATTVALVCVLTGIFERPLLWLSAGAGIAGMVVDSLLGATLERREILRNNGVNFISTAVAAGMAFLLS